MAEIKIESLKLTIGKKEIELSIEDARKLKGALDELFKKEEIHHWSPPTIIERHVEWPRWSPYYGLSSGTSIALCADDKSSTVLECKL